jgi:hypothetical protein
LEYLHQGFFRPCLSSFILQNWTCTSPQVVFTFVLFLFSFGFVVLAYGTSFCIASGQAESFDGPR